MATIVIQPTQLVALRRGRTPSEYRSDGSGRHDSPWNSCTSIRYLFTDVYWPIKAA